MGGKVEERVDAVVDCGWERVLGSQAVANTDEDALDVIED